MAAFISSSSDVSDALKYITAIVGLLTVVVTMPAILAAGRNIELQQQVYFARISSEERCRELHGHGRNILKYSGEGNDLSISMKEEQHGRKQYGHIFPNMVSKFSVCFSVPHDVAYTPTSHSSHRHFVVVALFQFYSLWFLWLLYKLWVGCFFW